MLHFKGTFLKINVILSPSGESFKAKKPFKRKLALLGSIFVHACEGWMKLSVLEDPTNMIVFSGAFISVIYSVTFPDCSFRSPQEGGWKGYSFRMKCSGGVALCPAPRIVLRIASPDVKRSRQWLIFFEPSMLSSILRVRAKLCENLTFSLHLFQFVGQIGFVSAQDLFGQGLRWIYSVPFKITQSNSDAHAQI